MPLAFGFAYALTRSCMRFKGVFRLIAMVPILVPSLLPGIALVYLFGNQGMLKGLLFGAFDLRARSASSSARCSSPCRMP